MPAPLAAPARALLAALLLASSCGPPPPAMPGATAASDEGSREADVNLGPPAIPPGKLFARSHVLLEDPCGDGCQFARRGESVLRLDLAPGGVAEAQDRGALLETMASVVGLTEHLTEWSRTWKGSWSADERTMEIRLHPTTTSCTRKSADATENPSCSPLPLLLRCFRAAVPLLKPKGRSTPGWACEPAAKTAPESLTFFPWVFGVRKRLTALDRGTQLQRERHYKGPRSIDPSQAPQVTGVHTAPGATQ